MSTDETNPTLVTRDGKQWWSFGDRLLPVVRGGAGDGDDGGNTDPTNGGGGPDNDDGNDDDQLGDGGKKALDSERRARSKAEKARGQAEKERDDAIAKLKELEEQHKTDTERERDKAVKEAEERVRTETLTTANQRLVKASVRVAAAGRLADPEDAVRFLELGEFKVDDEGEVDSKQIAAAIDALLKDKPYLAGKTKPQGNVDGCGSSEGYN